MVDINENIVFIYFKLNDILKNEFTVYKFIHMQDLDWESAWIRHYNNTSDDRLKTKSLNPMPLEQYSIKLPKISKKTCIFYFN